MPDKKPSERGGKMLGRLKRSVPRGGKPQKEQAANPNAGRLMLIVNPAAGTGEVTRDWDSLLVILRDLRLDFDFKFTERPGHAVEIATEAAAAGYGTLVAVGGDGTVNEVVNGMMALEREARPRLGIIPMGRCSDLCRTLQIPMNWITAASFLASGKKRSIDVGWMEYVSMDGVRTGYFTNVAGLGFDGEVTELAGKMPDALTRTVGGFGAYLLSLLITYARYHAKDLELQADGEVYHLLAATCLVANCRYLGGKMCIAPDAECDDGLFDVIVIGAGYGKPTLDGPEGTPPPERSFIQKTVARLKMARNVPAVYRGTHVDDESVMVLRASRVKIVSKDRMVVQADGEVTGEGPFTAEIIPGAIDVIA